MIAQGLERNVRPARTCCLEATGNNRCSDTRILGYKRKNPPEEGFKRDCTGTRTERTPGPNLLLRSHGK